MNLKRLVMVAMLSAPLTLSACGDDDGTADTGTDVTTSDVPVDTGYILNLDHVNLSSLMPQLFWSIDGFDNNVSSAAMNYLKGLDVRTLSYLMVAGFFGQAKYKPKCVGKLKNFAAS